MLLILSCICCFAYISLPVEELVNLPKAKGYSNCLHLLGPFRGRVCIIEVVLGTSLLDNAAVAEGGVLPLLRKKFSQPQVKRGFATLGC